MEIIKYRKIYFTISAVLVLASVAGLIFWGLKLGIDFKGGSLMEIEFKTQAMESQIIKEKIRDYFLSGVSGANEVEGLGEINIQPTENGAILRFKNVDEETHQKILNSLDKNYPENIEEKRFESVGPLIGQELRRRSLWAILLVTVMIILYITYAFRKVSRAIASWRYGVAAVAALAHDVLIPTGIFSFLGKFFGAEIGLLFVTALLTILGFSVHDTIVVFDRIRENLKKGLGQNFEETVNLSVNQTISRSINTSLTVLLTLFAIFVFGGESTKYFVLTLILGIIFGTYSSIFIASPLLVSWEKWRKK